MNDDIAVWAATNPVAGMHVLAIAEKLRVGRRFEGTLGLGSGEVEDWMGRRGLVRRGGNAEGTSFKERMRQLRDEAAGVEKKKERGEAVKKGVQRGEHGWRELPLVVVLLYSEVCGVDLTRMGDREGRAMLADWAGRYWPVSDEGMLEVMMEWGGERNGKVDIDPRKWRGEDEGKVERVIERTRGLGAEEVRRGGTLVGRLAGGVGRSGSVRTSKK